MAMELLMTFHMHIHFLLYAHMLAEMLQVALDRRINYVLLASLQKID